eukprot:TRINITY_DN16783_c0_g1_i1.p1 TRINITY_DN16783_c0_g1~~TRINITY_DN16783_c0_g1_i1.p1  ORF type:complete len:982 (+),score=145.49 TRINITY_DN16783_c0_g1_i1:32-2947(+)
MQALQADAFWSRPTERCNIASDIDDWIHGSGGAQKKFLLKLGHMEQIVHALRTDAAFNVNAKSSRGVSFLQLAVCSGHRDCVLELLDLHAEVNQQDEAGWTALHAACMTQRSKTQTNRDDYSLGKGTGKRSPFRTRRSLKPKLSFKTSRGPRHRQFQILKDLITHGADVNATSHKLLTPLQCAVRSWEFDFAEHLLEASASVTINHQDAKGQTALMLAMFDQSAARNLQQAVQVRQMNLMKGTGRGRRPVDFRDHPSLIRSSIVSLLLRNRADPSLKDSHQNDALGHLLLSKEAKCSGIPVDFVSMLISAGASTSGKLPLLIHSHWGKPEFRPLQQLLLSSSACVHDKDALGRSVLLAGICASGPPDLFKVSDRHGVPLPGLSPKNLQKIWRSQNFPFFQPSGKMQIEVEGVHDLLEMKASTEWQWFGTTSVTLAVVAGRPDITKLLLEYKGNVTWQDDQKRNALHFAVVVQASVGHAARNAPGSCVDLLLASCKTAALETDSAGRTPLMYALSFGHLPSIQALLPYSQINSRNAKGRSILMYAATCPAANILEHVLRANADLQQRDMRMCTALHYAIRANLGHQSCVIAQAVASQGGASLLNARDCNGRTPLHYTALYGHPHIQSVLLECLLGLGSLEESIGAIDKHGETVLQLACKGGHSQNVKMLLEAWPCIHHEGHTPGSSLAMAAPRWPIMHMLLEAGFKAGLDEALLKVCKMVAASPIDELAVKACVDGLLSYRADVRACDQMGRSCLILATQAVAAMLQRRRYFEDEELERRTSIISSLISQRSDVNFRDCDGRGALQHVAARCKHIETQRETKMLADLLLDAHANVNAVDYHGWSPLMQATVNGNSGLVFSFLTHCTDVPLGKYSLVDLAMSCNSHGLWGNWGSLAFRDVMFSAVCLLETYGRSAGAFACLPPSVWGNHVLPFLFHSEGDQSMVASDDAWKHAATLALTMKRRRMYGGDIMDV